jgi:hypothetical protein
MGSGDYDHWNIHVIRIALDLRQGDTSVRWHLIVEENQVRPGIISVLKLHAVAKIRNCGTRVLQDASEVFDLKPTSPLRIRVRS